MLAVFIGQNVEGNFRKTVCKILRKHIKATEISSEKIFEVSPDGDGIACIFSKDIKAIKAHNTAVFLNNCLEKPQIVGEKYCIIDSLNSCDLEIAKSLKSQVITCGLCTRDTLTFSSCREENCVISLQRGIKGFYGKIIEPFELPIYCGKDDDRYGILCAHLLLILLGKI